MPVEHTVWLDLLTDAERAQLRARVEPLPRRADLLVVGGGILGLATAAACQRAGLGEVVLIERGELAAGATRGSAGMLVPEAHVGVDPDWLVDLMRQSLELWHDLEATWPGGVGLVDMVWLVLEPLAAQLPLGLVGSRRLSAEEVHALMPRLATPLGGVLVEHQARVNPMRAALRLAAGLGCVATGVEAISATISDGRIARVGLSAGEIEVDRVVFATGGPPRIDGLDLHVPSGFVKGHLVATEPAPFGVPGYVLSLASQIEDGRLIVGSSTDPGDESTEVRPEIVDSLWSGFVDQLSAERDVRISHQWCCFRPWHPDSVPVLDRVPGVANAWFTSGHYKTGVLMAPVTGRLLAEWIRSGVRPSAAAPLSAERFKLD